MIPTLTRTLSNLIGDTSNLYGDVAGLLGNVTGIRGDVTGIRGNVDACGLTDTDRASGVHVSRLVVTAAEVPA